MKTVKYITSCVLILFVFLFIGESFIWHMNDFEARYIYTKVSVAADDYALMARDMDEFSGKHDVTVFTVARGYSDSLSMAVDIYGTKENALRFKTEMSKKYALTNPPSEQAKQGYRI